MKDFGRVRGIASPKEITFTPTKVFVASNIEPYSEIIDGYRMEGYEYDYVEYDKDEYITVLNDNNARAITELQEELAAAKILLGVD